MARKSNNTPLEYGLESLVAPITVSEAVVETVKGMTAFLIGSAMLVVIGLLLSTSMDPSGAALFTLMLLIAVTFICVRKQRRSGSRPING